MESILSQTYGDFELVVVDDASSDPTIEVIRRYREPRLRILENPRNPGNARNRSLAIRASRGELVKFVDQDDWIAPSCLAEHVRLMQANPGLGFSFSRHAISAEQPTPNEPAQSTGLRGRIAGAIRSRRSDWLDRLWLLEGLSEFGELWDRYPKLATLRRTDQKSLVVSMATGRYRAMERSDAISDGRAYMSHLARRMAGRPRSQFDRL